jgi:hypothetical protein
MEEYECDACGKEVYEDDVKWYEYGHYCENCYKSMVD